MLDKQNYEQFKCGRQVALDNVSHFVDHKPQTKEDEVKCHIAVGALIEFMNWSKVLRGMLTKHWVRGECPMGEGK